MHSKIRTLAYKAAASFALPHAFSLSTLLFAFCFFLFAFSPTVAQQITWQQTNGPYAGDVHAVEINSTTGFIFVGTVANGIFRSPDNGQTWTQVNKGLTDLNVWSFAINHKTHQIFAGTEEGKIFRSIDNGDNWSEIADLPGRIFSIALDPDDHRIFAGILDGILQGHIYRSVDNGINWEMLINNNAPDTPAMAIVLNSDGHVFAGTFGFLLRSIDGGDSWIRVEDSVWVTDIAFNSKGDMFATSASSGTETPRSGVLKSTDKGITWTFMNRGLPANLFVPSLAIGEQDFLYVGSRGGGVFRSTDNANNWVLVNDALIDNLVIDLAVNPLTGDLFAGTEGSGIFRSTNNGDGWVNIGLRRPAVGSVAINIVTGDIFAGTLASGVFRSTNNGKNWTQANFGLTDLNVLSFAITDNGHILTGTTSGLFRSTDNGNSWTTVNNGLPNDRNDWVVSLAVNQSGHIFVGISRFTGLEQKPDRLFRSTNNGKNWTEIAGWPGNIISCIAIDATTQNIFVGTADGVFRSTDNGDNWAHINNGLTDLSVSSLAINQSGHLFAGTDGSGVFNSTNKGDSWLKAGLTNLAVYSLAINESGHIFAGTENGVFRSRDNAASWMRVNSGLPDSDIFYNFLPSNIFASDPSGRIYAGTLRGVYRTVESTELVVSVPDFAAPPHAEFTLPIAVNDAFEIAGTEIELPFNTNLLWVKNVTTTSLTQGFALAWDTTGSVLKINLARASRIESGSGPLVNVTFKVNPTANFGDSIIIKFAKASLFDDNGRTILSLNNGAVFRVIKPAQRGDVNANGKVDVPDAILCLRMVAGLPLPTYPAGHVTPTSYESFTADCNGNGVINVGDAICILLESLGRSAPKLLASTSGSCNVTLLPAKTNVQAGEIVEVAVMAECDMVPAGAELALSYDANAFAVTDNDILAAVPGTLVTPNTREPGKIKAALVNLGGLLAPDAKMAIIRLTAKRSGNFANPIVLNEVQLFDDNGDVITGVEETAATMPTSFGLSQNYPNPFNPETSIAYQLPKDAHVSLQIYNLTGQVVATLANGKKSAGHHNALWNGRDEVGRQLPSGVYFYRLLVNKGEWAQVRKMTLLK